MPALLRRELRRSATKILSFVVAVEASQPNLPCLPSSPDYVPRHFAQGTTVKFTRSLPDFPPSDGWSYTLYLNGLTQKFNKAAAAQDPSTFLVELLPTDTAGLAPGPYRYAERLSNPGTDFVLTEVSVSGANGVYSYSSFTGPAPYVGMAVSITGFANGGNNAVPGVISALTGDASGGTFNDREL